MNTSGVGVVVDFCLTVSIGFVLFENWLLERRLTFLESLVEMEDGGGDDDPEKTPAPEPEQVPEPARPALKVVGR